MTPEEYLKQPYHFILVYDMDSDTWTGTIKEFPGCITQGSTFERMGGKMYLAALDWIAAALDLGQEIPKPEDK